MTQIPPGATLHDLDGGDLLLPDQLSMFGATLRRHRRTPIERLGTEALRFLLEEGESHPVLLRVAIDRLEADPFLAGDFHPGDLLVAALTRPQALFRQQHELRSRAYLIARDAEELLDLLEPADQVIVGAAIRGFMQALGGGR